MVTIVLVRTFKHSDLIMVKHFVEIIKLDVWLVVPNLVVGVDV